MKVHLINPSDVSFGLGVITPRWLFVIAGATPVKYGVPEIVDETLSRFDPNSVQPGDVVGIGIHTGNALRGYTIGKEASERGATVIFGGVHTTIFPQEPKEYGKANAVVTGDGDLVWQQVLADIDSGELKQRYDGGRIAGDLFSPARWELLPEGGYMIASVQTVRGCPKHCSFCSVWRTDGQKPRQRTVEAVIAEIVYLRRKGYRVIALADDNFYPVTLTDIELARTHENEARLAELLATKQERLDLMAALAQLPADMVFLTQITMEAAEDKEYLAAMQRAHIKGALVGVESVTAAGLKSVFKEFNLAGDDLVKRLLVFRRHGIHILGSFIFGLSTDGAGTFLATAELASKCTLFSQFVMLQRFPGTVDEERWREEMGDSVENIDGIPITTAWLLPKHRRPKVIVEHPTMTPDQIHQGTAAAWNTYYSVSASWKRSREVTEKLWWRALLVVLSKIYLSAYGRTGIATDSARVDRAALWSRWLVRLVRGVFVVGPMPELAMPESFTGRVLGNEVRPDNELVTIK